VNRKVALVTGATRGIGRALAEALVREGRTVVAVARDQAALASFAASTEHVTPLALDLAERGAPERAVEAALEAHGQIDELLCVAGIVHYAQLGNVSEQALRAQHDVNFVAPFLMAQRAGVHMRERGAGSILFFSSTLATRPAHETSAYAASKAALDSITHSFALELAPSVRVNALSLGVVDTDMVRVPRAAASTEPSERAQAVRDALESLRKLHLLGRLGQVDDVVQAALYLLSASWVTGTILTVDGGLSAG
jgi:NAD(P)-dependent dehydrogenase (short-subunit alcohol dehydrogenase family)